VELRVAIDVLAAFLGLAVGLQTIAEPAQIFAHYPGADPKPLPRQLPGQTTQAP